MTLLLVGFAADRFDLSQAYQHAQVMDKGPLNDGYGDLALAVTQRQEWEFPRRLAPFVSLAFLVFYRIGDGFQWIPFLHGIFYLTAIALLFLELERAVGLVAAFAGSIAAIVFTRTEFLRVPMSEGLSFFFATFALVAFLRAYRLGPGRGLFFLAVASALTALCRPALQFFLPMALVFILVSGLAGGVSRRSIGVLAAAVVFLLAPNLGWMLYNRARGGEFSPNNIAALSAAVAVLPYYSGTVPDHAPPEVRTGLGLVNRQLAGKLVSEADEIAIQTWLKLDEAPPACRSYRKILTCRGEDPAWLAEYFRRANMAFSMVLVDGARVALGEPPPTAGEHSTATYALAEEMSRVVLIDVLRFRRGAYLKTIGLSLQRQLEIGPPLTWRSVLRYETGLALLTALLGIGVCLGSAGRRRKPPTVFFAIALFGSVHLAHLLVCAVFGHASPRLPALLLPFFAAGPALLGGWLLARSLHFQWIRPILLRNEARA